MTRSEDKKRNLLEDSEVIYAYTRADALEDGELVDLTEWASAEKGFIGGFSCPVALTSALWSSIESIPKHLEGVQDIRGRAHDVLWMASLALKRAAKLKNPDSYFEVIMPVIGRGLDTLGLYALIHGGDKGEPVVTIGFPSDF